MTRVATCRCGQLSAICEGEPVRVSVCHCLDCQKRSGSAFAAQARFRATAVTVAGKANVWTRIGDSGTPATFHFCPVCSSIVYYRAPANSELIYVPLGGFADPGFPAPWVQVYQNRIHPWVHLDIPDEVVE